MTNKIPSTIINDFIEIPKTNINVNNLVESSTNINNNSKFKNYDYLKKQSEILFITSYPPRECGIATYSQDLIESLNNKFGNSFSIKVCALETNEETFKYDEKVIYILDTSVSANYKIIADKINLNNKIDIILVQHEFGFFQDSGGKDFLLFLQCVVKPIIIVFHTVLPKPNEILRTMVREIASVCKLIIIMTETSKGVLEQDYGIPQRKLEVIAHGTHLVSNNNKALLKEKYGFNNKKILSTFGLISSGKSIETTLDALPIIVKNFPNTIFLVLGKTHPGVVKYEGEKYRQMLEQKVIDLNLDKHVIFINQYLSLSVLLEYLRLTDIYLFTSKDPNQAVSGTFSYAMSCGCSIISTPIPQAREMLDKNTGIIIDFENSKQLCNCVIRLLSNEKLRKINNINTLHKISPSAWENSAIAHALLFEKTLKLKIPLRYNDPIFNLEHIKNMTTSFGMLQFAKINQPDIDSGYTIDDNARAMIAICMHYELTKEIEDLSLMETYLNFIKYCLQPEGNFLNYVNKDKVFTSQNHETNLEDSNGRALWALGFLISKKDILPANMIMMAVSIFDEASKYTEKFFSSRAMAFSIKGLYYYCKAFSSAQNLKLIEILAERLANMYKHESCKDWEWFESYLTYANSVMPEAMLMAWLTIKKKSYLNIATNSFYFLLSHTFYNNEIKVVSNKSWFVKGNVREYYGEQPIDVAYTILALDLFYSTIFDNDYLRKIKLAFNWFLGKNHLKQIIYNPCTGGCFDGLEEHQVNLNQGAESTVSYLMARATIEKYK